MKKTARIVSVFLLTALYCFAIGIVSSSYAHSGVQEVQSSEQDKCYSTVSSTIYSHISHSEISVTTFNNFPARGFKVQFDGLSAISKATEQLIETEFSQYSRLSRNFLTQNRKSDIIYPFHSYW